MRVRAVIGNGCAPFLCKLELMTGLIRHQQPLAEMFDHHPGDEGLIVKGKADIGKTIDVVPHTGDRLPSEVNRQGVGGRVIVDPKL